MDMNSCHDLFVNIDIIEHNGINLMKVEFVEKCNFAIFIEFDYPFTWSEWPKSFAKRFVKIICYSEGEIGLHLPYDELVGELTPFLARVWWNSEHVIVVRVSTKNTTHLYLL